MKGRPPSLNQLRVFTFITSGLGAATTLATFFWGPFGFAATQQALLVAGVMAWAVIPYATLALVSQFGSTCGMLWVASVDSAVNLLLAAAYIPCLIEGDGGFFPHRAAFVFLPIYQHFLVVVSFAVAWGIRAAQRLP